MQVSGDFSLSQAAGGMVMSKHIGISLSWFYLFVYSLNAEYCGILMLREYRRLEDELRVFQSYGEPACCDESLSVANCQRRSVDSVPVSLSAIALF